MGLEEKEAIEKANEIMTGLNKLVNLKWINMPRDEKALDGLEKNYKSLKEEMGKEFCNQYCQDAPRLIYRFRHELNSGVLE